MKATITQAENNERSLRITPSGYGHWKIECDYRGKRISATTTNSLAVDDFKSEFGEKDEDGRNRRRQGYVALCEQIIQANREY